MSNFKNKKILPSDKIWTHRQDQRNSIPRTTFYHLLLKYRVIYSFTVLLTHLCRIWRPPCYVPLLRYDASLRTTSAFSMYKGTNEARTNHCGR